MVLPAPSTAMAIHAFIFTRKFAFEAAAKESWIDPAMSRGTERDGWLIPPIVNSIALSLNVRPVLS